MFFKSMFKTLLCGYVGDATVDNSMLQWIKLVNYKPHDLYDIVYC